VRQKFHFADRADPHPPHTNQSSFQGRGDGQDPSTGQKPVDWLDTSATSIG